MKRIHADEETVNEHKPISNTFQILCDEANKDSIASTAIISEWKKVAYDTQNILQSAKLSHSTPYKAIDYWDTKGVSFPLKHISDSITRTNSSLKEYKWIPPTEFTIISDSIVHVGRPSDSVVNIFIVIPNEIFGNRDYINTVYAIKRAHYMCSCIVILKKKLKNKNIQFCLGPHGDTLYPSIQINDDKTSGCLRLNFSAAESFCKPNRLASSVANLRPSSIFPEITDLDEHPTPYFNQRMLRSLLECGLRQELQLELRQKITTRKALGLAAKWFKCRSIEQCDDLFLMVIAVYLLRKKDFNEKHDVLFILRRILSTIIDLDNSSIIGLHSDLPDEVLNSHKEHFHVVVLDSTGYWNLANNISKNLFLRMKSELSQCLPYLGDCSSFDSLFIDDYSFYSAFDHYIRCDFSIDDLKPLIPQLAVDAVDEADLLNSFQRILERNLDISMAERYDYLDIRDLMPLSTIWDISSPFVSPKVSSFLIGFRINKGWNNPLTIGPIATDQGAKEFRLFWKDSTQLRKFADTRICECVVWADLPSDTVPLNVLKFVGKSHLHLREDAFSLRSSLSSSICVDRIASTRINDAFASLSSILRSLKDLPLSITNIHAISPYIRATEPVLSTCYATIGDVAVDNDHSIPSVMRIPAFTPSLTVHIKLEFSYKWGTDEEAIRRLTSAFYIQIADQLKSAHKLIAVATMDQLFVLKDKIVFKLVVVHDKIMKILESRLKALRDSGATRIESTPDGVRLAAFHKKYIAETALQGSLLSLATKHSVYADTVQLTKLWIGAKLMSNMIPDIVVELLVASTFHISTRTIPQTLLAAFRQVLHLLISHNWTTRPLVVDFNEAWNEDELAKLELSFVKMRPVLPPMVILTNEDTVGSKWTREGPTPVILKRLITMARSTLQFFDQNMINKSSIHISKSLLAEDYTAYDAVVELYPKMITRQAKEQDDNTILTLPVVDFDPIDELIYGLNNHFHHVAMFFYNKYGGDKIGIKFKPQEMEVAAKISRCCLHFPNNGSTLSLNVEEILEGVRLLGRGIVKDIHKPE